MSPEAADDHRKPGVEEPGPGGPAGEAGGRNRGAMSLEPDGVLFGVSDSDLPVCLGLQEAVVFRTVLEVINVSVLQAECRRGIALSLLNQVVQPWVDFALSHE